MKTKELIKTELLATGDFVDNCYLDNYLAIVVDCCEEYKKFETCKHHILPVCYYKLHKLEVNNYSTNLVTLSHKNHILAHFYLTKCTINDLNKSLIFAFNFMINEKNRYKIYNKIENIIDIDYLVELRETFSRLCSERQSSSIQTKESRVKAQETFKRNYGVNSASQLPGVGAKISKSKKGVCTCTEKQRKLLSETARKFWTGKQKSQEHKQKISNTLKGHEVSKETREKISASCKGNRTFNKNTFVASNYKIIYLNISNFKSIDDIFKYLLNNKLNLGAQISNSLYKDREIKFFIDKAKRQINNLNKKLLA